MHVPFLTILGLAQARPKNVVLHKGSIHACKINNQTQDMYSQQYGSYVYNIILLHKTLFPCTYI